MNIPVYIANEYKILFLKEVSVPNAPKRVLVKIVNALSGQQRKEIKDILGFDIVPSRKISIEDFNKEFFEIYGDMPRVDDVEKEIEYEVVQKGPIPDTSIESFTEEQLLSEIKRRRALKSVSAYVDLRNNNFSLTALDSVEWIPSVYKIELKIVSELTPDEIKSFDKSKKVAIENE
jgi:hypothetical protein